MNSLVGVTSANFGAARQQSANAVQVRNVQYIPAVQQGILEIRCETFSRSSDVYKTIIRLQNVEYIDNSTFNSIKSGESEDSSKYNVFEFTGSDGSPYHVRYNRGSSVDVQVGCGCKDFRWRFAYYNSADGSFTGTPPEPYVSQTNRPPVNPSKTPGVCKHLIKLKKELERESFFKELLN